MDYILLERLKSYVGETIFYGDIEISLKELKSCLYNYETQFEECSAYIVESYSKSWHIGRVRYFVENPDKITPLEIYDGDLLDGFISDGNHRYLACLFLNKTYVSCYYNGCIDFLDSLKF